MLSTRSMVRYSISGMLSTRSMVCSLPDQWYAVNLINGMLSTRSMVHRILDQWYAVYAINGMQSTRSVVCGLLDQWYAVYSISGMWSTWSMVCSLLDQWYAVYSTSGMQSTRSMVRSLLDQWYVSMECRRIDHLISRSTPNETAIPSDGPVMIWGAFFLAMPRVAPLGICLNFLLVTPAHINIVVTPLGMSMDPRVS